MLKHKKQQQISVFTLIEAAATTVDMRGVIVNCDVKLVFFLCHINVVDKKRQGSILNLIICEKLTQRSKLI